MIFLVFFEIFLILIFFVEKKLFNIFNTKLFVFFCLKSNEYPNVIENRIFTKEYCSESLKRSQPRK